MGKHAHSHHQNTGGIALLTISDTRGESNDGSGDWLAQALQDAGHQLCLRGWVSDDPDAVEMWVQDALHQDQVDLILTTGGTGLSARDRTVEALQSLIRRPLPGFGELFRVLSYEEIGSAAMMSRAFGGQAVKDKFIFCLPGSTAAVKLGWSKLIAPEVSHLLGERDKE